MTKAMFAKRRRRIGRLNAKLKHIYPDADIELIFGNPLELLIAVQLSAQCTDKMVNRITRRLFKKYRNLNAYVKAGESRTGIRAFERDIKSSGFYRAKTRNILAAAAMIKTEFGGNIPRTMNQILRLPGVARKTATVVLATAFGVVEGVTVDTHVIRFAKRFDLSDYTDAVRIEKDLMQLLPKSEWVNFTHRVIHYGRYLAPARRYDVTSDPLIKIYPPAAKRFRV